jgi:outer membrane lipopolysaccharide assembly protein LptE/RlpB
MKQTILKSFLVFYLLLTSNCGFKVLDKSKQNNFSIKEIKTTGDKRINFKIKNLLLNETLKNSEKNISINLITKKTKKVKEKSIKNEITKYAIKLDSNIVFNIEKEEIEHKIIISVEGDYLVDDSYSTTLNNEKKLIENLITDISEKILDKIVKKINDL